ADRQAQPLAFTAGDLWRLAANAKRNFLFDVFEIARFDASDFEAAELSGEIFLDPRLSRGLGVVPLSPRRCGDAGDVGAELDLRLPVRLEREIERAAREALVRGRIGQSYELGLALVDLEC